MSAPRVSIVTVSLNALSGLQRTVASVAAQSSRDYEHIVVDGGSTDGTREWLREVDVPIEWISEADSGIADAMNKGVMMSSGEWILFLHSEDTFAEDDSLESALPALDTDAEIVSHHVEVVEGDRSRIYKSRGFDWRINFKTIPHQGAFSRRTLFDTVGAFGRDLTVGMDYDFFLRAHRHGSRADVVDTVLSTMPATGISSRRDSVALRERFREERVVQFKNSIGRTQRLMYMVYWPPYLGYRRMRHALSSRSIDAKGLR